MDDAVKTVIEKWQAMSAEDRTEIVRRYPKLGKALYCLEETAATSKVQPS